MSHLFPAILAAWLVVAVAPTAHGLSLTLDVDKATWGLGETLSVTATLDTTGAPAGQLVDVTLSWNPATAIALNPTATFTLGSSSQLITAGPNVGSSNLTSFAGGLPWTGPPQSGCVLLGSGAGNTCIILNQVRLGVARRRASVR